VTAPAVAPRTAKMPAVGWSLPSPAAVGICIYVGGLLTAFEPDLPLIALALAAAFAALVARPSPRE
jgi:hypothetical protein